MFAGLGIHNTGSSAAFTTARAFFQVNELGQAIMTSSAVYKLLDEERREIRLATIWPAAEPTALVKVTLDVVSLLDEPAFEALSYCWGSAEITKPIELCGRITPVTTKLDAALRQFRHDANGQALSIWIDAICINQADDVEKGQQVALMREIYSTASNVRVWFGLATPLTELGFRHLDYVLTRSHDYMGHPHPGGEDPFVPKDYCSVEAWKALGEIFRNPYWSRRWVAQEIVLAKTKTLHCGSQIAGPFDDPLFFTAPLLIYSRRIQEAGMRIMTSQGLSRELVDDYSMMADEANAIILATSTMVQAQEPESEMTATQLNQFFRANSSDDRDLVYGILGLLPADIGIQPDYFRKAEDVFEDFAFRYMQRSRSLNLLYLAGRGDASMPSWVPDLRYTLRSASDHSAIGTGYDDRSMSPLLSYDRQHYNPSAGATFHISYTFPGELTLPGMIVDTIIATGSKEPENNSLQRITIRTILEWKELYQSSMKQQGSAYPEVDIDDLIRTACADFAMDGSTKKFHGYTPSNIQLYRAILGDPVLCFSQDSDPAAMFGHWQWVGTLSKTNRFVVTAGGRHGLVFGDVAIGDQICVVASSILPLVLRKTEHSETCHVVKGSAYVHGLMGGEAILAAVEARGLASVDDAFEDIILV